MCEEDTERITDKLFNFLLSKKAQNIPHSLFLCSGAKSLSYWFTFIFLPFVSASVPANGWNKCKKKKTCRKAEGRQ